jgi:ribosomal protein L44E
MNRKQRRALQKAAASDPTQELSNKVTQFSKLPECCMACRKDFDKKDKEMINTWNVVVKQDVVRLFCPECIKKTQEALNASHPNI